MRQIGVIFFKTGILYSIFKIRKCALVNSSATRENVIALHMTVLKVANLNLTQFQIQSNTMSSRVGGVLESYRLAGNLIRLKAPGYLAQPRPTLHSR